MGYYTRYTLKHNAPHKESFILTEIKLSIITQIDKQFEDLFIKGFYKDGKWTHVSFDRHKWYDHEDDMKEIAKQFPSILFELHGEGEENGDLWVKYFKGDKFQHCPAKITYDPCLID
jgi:hypothetical protein